MSIRYVRDTSTPNAIEPGKSSHWDDKPVEFAGVLPYHCNGEQRD